MKLNHALYLLFAMANVITLTARAETPGQVTFDLQQKTALITALQNQIVAHGNMTLDDIQKDLGDSLNRVSAAFHGTAAPSPEELQAFNYSMGQLELELSLQNKDEILADETLELQQLMSSENYIFIFTRSVGSGCTGKLPQLYVIAFLIDVIGLPIEIIASILTIGQPGY